MSKRIPLILACGDYEITRPLKEGAVVPDGIDLTVLTAMDSTTRHWRFLRGLEFDMAEVSCGSYITARDRGFRATAIPVFLHRRFRHGFIFINTGKGITNPKDLIGKRVGLKQFQATAIIWMRGILESEYGVPADSIEWVCELDETIEFAPPPGRRIVKLGDDETVEGQLARGELDALLHPDLIKPLVQKDPRVARLFPDYMFHAFNQAKSLAMKRMENPRIAPLIWYREAWEEQGRIVGSDPWEYGRTDRNVHNIDVLAGYCHADGLSKGKFSFDDLFSGTFQGRKRGEEFRF